MMAGAIERFMDAARAQGLEPEIRRFPEGTKTAEDAARAIGCDVAQIVKSLVFVADDRPVLALTSGRNRVDTDTLASLIGATAVRRATPDEAKAATGYAVGGTPPFAHPAPIRTLMDPDLLAFDEIWAAAGTPDAVFRLGPRDLRRAAGATEAGFTERR